LEPLWTYASIKDFKAKRISYFDLCDLFKADYGKVLGRVKELGYAKPIECPDEDLRKILRKLDNLRVYMGEN